MKSTIVVIVLFSLILGGGCACGAYCSSCVNGTCYGCVSSYYMNTSSSHCFSCGDTNCNICSMPHNCSHCNSGYSPRTDDHLCIVCSQTTDLNCDSIYSSCNSSNGCAPCKKYAINGNNQCLACSYVYRNCQTCDNNACLTCQSGYALNSSANNLECVACNFPRCDYCSSGPVCSSCINGYYPVNNICLPCIPPCLTCSSVTNCYSCSSLYYRLSNGSCLLCNDSSQGMVGCSTCSIVSSNFTCSSCLPTYKMESNGTCSSCIPGCLTCNSTNCLSCINNGSYIFNNSTYTCDPCSTVMANCSLCANYSVCLACDDGYIIDSNPNQCVNCSSLFQGCSKCDINQCYQCLTNFTMAADFSCSAVCASLCLTCTTVTTECKSCITGYYLTGTNCTQCNLNCTSCLNSSYCTTCISDFENANGTCQPCTAGQVFNPFTLLCQNCSVGCVSCYWWTGCDSCINLYELTVINGINACADVCGDTYAIDLPCDLPKGIANDGCTDQCTIEPGYNCSETLGNFSINGTTSFNTSQCSYIGTISVSISGASQSIISNTLTLTFSVVPYLYGFPVSTDPQVTIQSVFQLSSLGPSASYQVSVDSQAQTVTFHIDHSSDITNLAPNFIIDFSSLSSNQMFQYLSNIVYPFQVNKILSYGRLGQWQTEQSLKLSAQLYNWSSGLAIIAIVLMVIGIFGKELAALDQVIICQSVFFLLTFYKGQLTLPQLSISGLKYSTGFHFSDSRISLSQGQSYIMSLDSSSFLYNFNFNLCSYAIPLVISFFVLIYKLKYKHLPSKRDIAQQTYEVIMGETILYLAIFNLLPLISYAYLFYTESSKNSYYDNVAIFTASLFLIFGIFNYFVKPQIVGIFRSCFKTESEYRQTRVTGWIANYTSCISKRCFQEQLSSIYIKITNNFYLVYIIYLFFLAFINVLAPFQPIFIVVIVQTFILVLVLLIRPHFNIIEKLRGVLTWTTTLLGSLIVFLKPTDFFLPITFLIFLSVHIVLTVVVIVASIIHQIKRKCNDRSEVVRRLMKQGQAENQKEALRQLILRYQHIERKNITIDHQVEKIQMKFNDDDDNPNIPKENQKPQVSEVAKIQNTNQNVDEQMIRFEDEIIQEQHDHFRFQKGLDFFNKYEDKIDKDLVKQEYPDII